MNQLRGGDIVRSPRPPTHDRPKAGHRPRLRRGLILVGVTLGALVVLVLLTAPSLFAARRHLITARSGIEAARTALTAHDTARAAADLDGADASLHQAVAEGHRLALRLLRPVPIMGSPVKALEAGARAGGEALAAGRILRDAAETFPSSGQAGANGHDLSVFRTAAQRASEALLRASGHFAAARQALEGPAGAALPLVSAPARSMLRTLDTAQRQLSVAARGLTLVSRLTAPEADVRLLLVSQDTMELRPTGGLIGSYGVIHFAGGGVTLERYEQVDSLPPPNPPLPVPDVLADALVRIVPGTAAAWGLPHAGWWPDFPTSGAEMMEMFRRQVGGDVAGVVAITEHVVARLVGALGPIKLPSYAEPVTDAGFDQRVLYEVELKSPADVPRKKFLVELADEVFGRMFSLAPDQVPAVADALGRAAGAGDLQVFFRDPAWQADIAGTALDGALPAVTGDFLMLVEANLTPSKANAGLVRDVRYRVRPGRDGRLRATLTISYRNEAPVGPTNRYYDGFLRVYVPRGSTLLDKGAPAGDASMAPDGPFGVFSRAVFLAANQTEVATFDYLLPKNVVKKGGYRLTWLRQPGTPRDTLIATIGNRSFEASSSRRFDVSTPAPGSHRGLRWLLPG